jgi:hypothetical protein
MTQVPNEIYDTLMHMQGVGDDRAVCVTLGALRALTTPPAPVVGDSYTSELDWPEDFSLENGNYSNRCCECNLFFVGHKRRVACKRCTKAKEALVAPVVGEPVATDAPTVLDGWYLVENNRHVYQQQSESAARAAVAEIVRREKISADRFVVTQLATHPAPTPAPVAGQDSNLYRHAEHELNLLGEDGPMRTHLLHMVATFSEEGHSGFSASHAVGALTKLLAFEPLAPLTGADEEWTEVSAGLWQNKRCSHVFKDANGAYDANGRIFRELDGTCFVSAKSRVSVSFPYTPTREYVDVGGGETAPVVGEPVAWDRRRVEVALMAGAATASFSGKPFGVSEVCDVLESTFRENHPAPAPTACERCAEAVDAANWLLAEGANLRARLAAPAVCARCGSDGVKP